MIYVYLYLYAVLAEVFGNACCESLREAVVVRTEVYNIYIYIYIIYMFFVYQCICFSSDTVAGPTYVPDYIGFALLNN